MARLQRDHIDIVLLHINALEVGKAALLFDEMDRARQAGKIGSFGWSTDFPASITAMAPRAGFTTVEHAMNVFFDAPSGHTAIAEADLWGLVRSPLAMGILSGKAAVSADDIRAHDEGWNNYFVDGVANPDYISKLDTIRELLQSGGRSLVQGALGWVMARGPRSIPLPGARTVAQVEHNAKALEYGPLPAQIMSEIEQIMDRGPEGPPRER